MSILSQIPHFSSPPTCSQLLVIYHIKAVSCIKRSGHPVDLFQKKSIFNYSCLYFTSINRSPIYTTIPCFVRQEGNGEASPLSRKMSSNVYSVDGQKAVMVISNCNQAQQWRKRRKDWWGRSQIFLLFYPVFFFFLPFSPNAELGPRLFLKEGNSVFN